MSTIQQLEHETEQERARISETLDELRARMTPGHVVDQLVDYASDSSGGMFFRNLRQQAVDNPIPVALMGAGLAWLVISGRRDSSSDMTTANLISRTAAKGTAAGDEIADRARHAADAASETASQWRDQARSAAADLRQRGEATASNLQDSVREAADAAADRASSSVTAGSELGSDATSRAQGAARSAIGSVTETASATYDVAANQARRASDKLQTSASHMRGKVAATGQSIMDFVHEQPLVLVGLGVAIGAVIGAASPATAAEDELMGESSDAVKEEATELAKEHMRKGQAVAERAWQSATEEAEEQGLASRSSGDDGALASHQDSASDETPLAPSTKAPASREGERSEH